MTNIIISFLPFLGTFKNCHTMLSLYLFTFLMLEIKPTASYMWNIHSTAGSVILLKKFFWEQSLINQIFITLFLVCCHLDFLNRGNSNCAHRFYFIMNNHILAFVCFLETTETTKPTRRLPCSSQVMQRSKSRIDFVVP